MKEIVFNFTKALNELESKELVQTCLTKQELTITRAELIEQLKEEWWDSLDGYDQQDMISDYIQGSGLILKE